MTAPEQAAVRDRPGKHASRGPRNGALLVLKESHIAMVTACLTFAASLVSLIATLLALHVL
jgi:hypothetical protein